MKILYIAHGFPPANSGGVEVYAHNLSSTLSFNNEVVFFHRTKDVNKAEYSIEQYKLGNVDIFSINNTFCRYASFRDTYKNEAIADKFSTLIDSIKPDIVHIQHLMHLGAKIIEEIKRKNIPIVFTLHDYWLICPQGQLFHDDKYICSGAQEGKCKDCIAGFLSLKPGINNIHSKLRKIFPVWLVKIIKNMYISRNKAASEEVFNSLIMERLSYMKYVISMVDLFIAPSSFLKNQFINFGIPADKIVLSQFGFNFEKMKPLPKISSQKIRFSFIGSSLAAKGLTLLIKAFNDIVDDKAELKIYGPLGGLYDTIKNSIKNKNIKIMGAFNNENITKIFSGTDILIVPSIWHEVFGIVILEAFACGVPVIASKIGAIPELINDGINGLLFEPGSTASLKEKIKSIINDKALLNFLCDNVKIPKDFKEHAKEIELIYSKVLSGKARA